MKFLLKVSVFSILWVSMGVIIDYYQLSRTWSAFWGFCVGTAYFTIADIIEGLYHD